MMTDSELKKSNIQRNTIEKRRLDLLNSIFDNAKRNVAIDMRKSQADFKHRLKKYKDRQKEILMSKPAQTTQASMGEFLLHQIRSRHSPSPTLRSRASPTNKSRKGGSVWENEINEEEEFEADKEFGKISSRQRSKLDLRPGTAWSMISWSKAGRKVDKSGVSRSVAASRPDSVCNPFRNMTGRLGSPMQQVRYFDEDEIQERGSFYEFLLKNRLKEEQSRFGTIMNKVTNFCKQPHPVFLRSPEDEEDPLYTIRMERRKSLRRQSRIPDIGSLSLSSKPRTSFSSNLTLNSEK